MQLFCVTKNSGPSMTIDHLRMLYLGPSLEKAYDAVGDFRRYQVDIGRYTKYPKDSMWSALPKVIDWMMVSFYMADGWWMSVVRFDVEELT